MSIDATRREYQGPPLDVADVADDPLSFFGRWYVEAQRVVGVDADVMCLATVDAAGAPHARIVLLRGHDQYGLRFFTNTASEKGQQLATDDRVALVFYWSALDRQVRVEGHCRPLDREAVESYFQSRPRTSQLAASAATQSAVLPDRATLERAMEAVEREVGEGPVPLPPAWGGYLVQPDHFEFWQGRPSRLHDRVRCRRQGDDWLIDRLAP